MADSGKTQSILTRLIRLAAQCVRDVRFATRLFRRQPILFAMTVTGVAIAIGISATTFGFVNAAALRGSGFADPDSLVSIEWLAAHSAPITGNSPVEGNWAYRDFIRLQTAAKSIDMAASSGTLDQFRSSAVDPGARLNGMAVSGNFFRVTGGIVTTGRALAPSDDSDAAPPVIVLSHGLWVTAFGKQRDVIGRTVWLSGRPFTVVGVASRGFLGSTGVATPPSYWITLGSQRVPAIAASGRAISASVWNPAVEVLGRIRDEATHQRAETEVRALASRLENDRTIPRPEEVVARFSPASGNREARAISVILMTLVGLVVAVAIANVTNILLAHASMRSREIGTRLALGATGARVVAQLLTESLVLGVAGGMSGFLVSVWATPWVARVIELPPVYDVGPDARVLSFVALLTIVASLLAGLAPARFGRKGDVIGALRQDTASIGVELRGGRFRSLLLASQTAFSILLLVLATLLTRSLVVAASQDPGYDAKALLSISFSRTAASPTGRDADRARLQSALDQIRTMPGVSGASLAAAPPFAWVTSPQRLPTGWTVSRNETFPDYFSTLGLRVLRGRTYSAEEVAKDAPVAVISATLAYQAFGSLDVVGQSMDEIWGMADPSVETNSSLMRRPPGGEIIGVVQDALTDLAPEKNGRAAIYLPLARNRMSYVVVRSRGDVRMLTEPLRTVLRNIEPSATIDFRIAADEMDRQLNSQRNLAALGVVAGTVALSLAVVGLFGATAFTTGQRRHEIMVRITLGATRQSLVRLLLRDSLRPIFVGMAFGLVLALGLGRALQPVLYGVSAQDPVALGSAVVILSTAAAAAVLPTILRASRQQPGKVLKET